MSGLNKGFVNLNFFAEQGLSLFVMALLLLCSAFFSGTETALFSLTREQLKRLRDQGSHVEKLLGLLANNPSGLLISILFGNLVVNILYFSVSVVMAGKINESGGEWGEAAVGLVVLVLVILVGEIFPKAAGISFSERVVRTNALPLRAWYLFMGPVRRILEWITRHLEPDDTKENQLNAEELKMLIDATQHDPTF